MPLFVEYHNDLKINIILSDDGEYYYSLVQRREKRGPYPKWLSVNTPVRRNSVKL